MVKAFVKTCKVKGMFVVANDRGLHTRPSTEIVRCASSFKSDVKLCYHKLEVNAKSLLGILMLAASKGAKIGIVAEGEDAHEAVATLLQLARNNFNIKY
jgi:phosphocarrier protein HPr